MTGLVHHAPLLINLGMEQSANRNSDSGPTPGAAPQIDPAGIFAVSNYIAENRDVALRSQFRGKPLSETLKLTPFSQDKSGEKEIGAFLLKEVDNPALAALQLEYMLQKDTLNFLTKKMGSIEKCADPAKKVEKISALLLLAGKLPVTAGMSQPDALTVLETELSKVSLKSLQSGVEASIDPPIPPVAAIALYCGADKPWVKRRLEATKDPTLWKDLVIDNFNVSPKVLMAQLNAFSKSHKDDPTLKDCREILMRRPDFQGFTRTQCAALKEDPKNEVVAGNLKFLAGFAPDIDDSAAVLIKIFEDLKKVEPPAGDVALFRDMGRSDDSARLRASYVDYARNNSDSTMYETAARRLLAATVGGGEIRRNPPTNLTHTISGSIKRFAEKVKGFFEAGKTPRLEDLSDGYTSWEHKDQCIEAIESELIAKPKIKISVPQTPDVGI